MFLSFRVTLTGTTILYTCLQSGRHVDRCLDRGSGEILSEAKTCQQPEAEGSDS